MKSSRKFSIAAMVAVSVSLIGCGSLSQSDHNSNVYSASSMGRPQYVEYATVVSTRPIVIQKEGVIGSIGGAVVGGMLGSQIGGGRGQMIGGLAGVLAGASVGKAVDQNTSQEAALEITVQRANGQTVAVAQGADQNFAPGERVKLIQENGKMRITR